MSMAKMIKTERNLQLRLLGKLVSREKIFETVVGRTYLDQQKDRSGQETGDTGSKEDAGTVIERSETRGRKQALGRKDG